MAATNPLSLAYADLLVGQYDCVDRIILNAYFPFACAAGGFRPKGATTRSTTRGFRYGLSEWVVEPVTADRGHDVAGRPLPAGAPIAASKYGTASRGQ